MQANAPNISHRHVNSVLHGKTCYYITSVPSQASSCRCIDDIAPVNDLSADDSEVVFLFPGCKFVSRPPSQDTTCNTVEIDRLNWGLTALSAQ